MLGVERIDQVRHRQLCVGDALQQLVAGGGARHLPQLALPLYAQIGLRLNQALTLAGTQRLSAFDKKSRSTFNSSILACRSLMTATPSTCL